MLGKGTRMFAGLFVVLSLAGCSTAQLAPSSGAACGIFKPIRWSQKKDSPPTVRQIVGHNAAGAAACGWSKK